MDSSLFSMEKFKEDTIRAVDAKFEAQKIAFAPLCFQAVRALIELELLQAVEDSGETGITRAELAQRANISEYGAGVLCEMALGMNVIKLAKTDREERFVIGKIGWMLLNDDLTKANFWFTNDICYQGAWDLAASVKSGRPEGLKVFGDKWTTVYEALSSLPEKAKKIMVRLRPFLQRHRVSRGAADCFRRTSAHNDGHRRKHREMVDCMLRIQSRCENDNRRFTRTDCRCGKKMPPLQVSPTESASVPAMSLMKRQNFPTRRMPSG